MLRLALMAVYSPAALQNGDAISYVTFAPFVDTRQPSGIYLFVEPFEWVGSLTLLVLAQHLLGVLTAVLIASAARRLGCGWIATAAAAGVALFGSTQLYLEHALLSEPLFSALAAAALLALLHVDRADAWVAATTAGVLAGASYCTGSAGVAVIAAVAIGALALCPRPPVARVLRAGTTVLAAMAVIGVYMLAVAATDGGQTGTGQWSGWYTYARAAPFADCRRFTPPRGTEVLCQRSSPGRRPGPEWYMFHRESPAYLHFGGPPNGDDLLQSFGRAAIRSEPVAYARTVGTNFLRYFDDDFGPEIIGAGASYESVALDDRDPASEEAVAAALGGSGFGEVSAPTVRTPNAIELYAALFALDGRILLTLLVLAVVAVALTSGRRRVGAALYLFVSLALLAVPVLTLVYQARYAIPAHLLLAVPAALGVQAIADRLRERRASSSDAIATA